MEECAGQDDHGGEDLHQPEPGVGLAQAFAVPHEHAQFSRAEGHFAGRDPEVEENQQNKTWSRDLSHKRDFQKPGDAVGQLGADDDAALQKQVHTDEQGQHRA